MHTHVQVSTPLTVWTHAHTCIVSTPLTVWTLYMCSTAKLKALIIHAHTTLYVTGFRFLQVRQKIFAMNITSPITRRNDYNLALDGTVVALLVEIYTCVLQT